MSAAAQCNLIVHDVLQPLPLPRLARKMVGRADPYQLLVERLQWLEGYPVDLAIVGDGIATTPIEVVRYLAGRNEWRIQCHGLRHVHYDELNEEQCRVELEQACRLIEDAFGVYPTKFIPPFNTYNAMTRDIAQSLGMREIDHYRIQAQPDKCYATCRQLDVHWWHLPQMLMASAIAKYHTMTDPIIIVGAPRSGTTALMRFVAQEHPFHLVLKEHERQWLRPHLNLRWYYARQLAGKPHSSVIDKNVRNSKRLAEFAEQFPNATYIHIVRDGRAAISSWRDWAVKTHKDDQTIAGAARQWCEFVEAVLAFKKDLKHYTELRYENLCEEEDYFDSRNNKWQQRLTADELRVIDHIAGPLLRRLGYA